jgi:phosphinothricin acetyltransferase
MTEAREYTVRKAENRDLDAIFRIRNDVIRSSDAILEDEPWPEEKCLPWWNARDLGLPCLVLVDGAGAVQGYAILAYYGDRSGYRVTGEVSIHLDPSARGRGYGKVLFEALIEAGRAFGFRSLMSRITANNTGSVRMHERAGFRQVGYFPEIAKKFGRYVDVGVFQLRYE